MKAVLVKHFESKPVIIAERFQFHRRNQAVGETVAEYEAELRKLATHCAFGDYPAEAIRDRIVCGPRSESTQKRLPSEDDLTLAKTIEIAQGMEAADRNAVGPKGSSELKINEVTVGTRHCRYRCGSDRHKGKDCRHKETICNNCKKKGHLARVCRSSTAHKLPITSQSSKGNNPQKKDTNWVSTIDDYEHFPDSTILTVGTKQNKPITVQLELNRQQVLMQVDTGAAVILMAVTTQELFPDAYLEQSSVRLQTYTAKSLEVLGTMEVQVKYGNYVGNHVLYVVSGLVSGNGPALLGQDWLMTIRLDWYSLD